MCCRPNNAVICANASAIIPVCWCVVGLKDIIKSWQEMCKEVSQKSYDYLNYRDCQFDEDLEVRRFGGLRSSPTLQTNEFSCLKQANWITGCLIKGSEMKYWYHMILYYKKNNMYIYFTLCWTFINVQERMIGRTYLHVSLCIHFCWHLLIDLSFEIVKIVNVIFKRGFTWLAEC